MEQLRQCRSLSEQDGGPFLEVFTLHTDGDRFFAQVSAGYGPERHNDEAWYLLDAEPTKWPKDDEFDCYLDVYTDQSNELEHLTGVTGNPTTDPHSPTPAA